MTAAEFDQVSNELVGEADAIAKAKRPAYTIGDSDVLANFKRVAERTGVTPMQAFCVYMLKHIDAITTLAAKPDAPQAEDIKGRFADAINYLKLGYAIYRERQLASPQYVPYNPQEESVTQVRRRLGGILNGTDYKQIPTTKI